MHTAIPGRVVSFDPESCTATIQPVGKYVTSAGKKLDYPQVTEVPFCFPYCSSADVGIAFPVKAGDSCLLIFSEVELDEWRTGATADNKGNLKFDLTSAIAIPGLLRASTALTRQASESDAVVVGAGSTTLQVSATGVHVQGNLSVTGSISASGDVTGGGISLSGHHHTAPADGGTTSVPF